MLDECQDCDESLPQRLSGGIEANGSAAAFVEEAPLIWIVTAATAATSAPSS